MNEVAKNSIDKQDVIEPPSAKDKEELDATDIQEELEQDDTIIDQANNDMREEKLDDEEMIGF